MVSLPGLAQACAESLDFKMRRLSTSEQVHLCQAFDDKVVLIVNTASKCVFTDQYAGLEELYRRYSEQGLVVLGFPSNDFANQEPGEEKQIKNFCRLTYGVQFPMFEKLHVRKGQAHPFYEKLAQLSGVYPQWNFHKYLIGRDGRLLASFPSQIAPEHPRLRARIEHALKNE